MRKDTVAAIREANASLRRQLSRMPGNLPALFVVFVVVGLGGGYLLSNSHAATQSSSVEPENGTLASAATVNDATASNGKAVKFGSGATGGSCPAGQVGTPPNCFAAPPAPLLSGKQWKVIFNDDFDGSSLNTAKWTPCFDWNYGDCTGTFNNGRERYYPSQVQLSGGTAKLVAEPMSPAVANAGCYQGSCTYKAGLISTARPRADNGSAYLAPFTYGYVEGRMKYPAVSGFFTAFWMLPTNTDFEYRTEIDIVEILGGDPNTIFMTYHYNDRSSSHAVNNGDHTNGNCQVKDYSTDFVRFGLDWEPTYVAWYINGTKCGQFNGNSSTIENGPMQLILHMMIDNNWERDWGLVLANQTLKAQLEVDYVRVYQQQ
jgi:beta-glucanase (GH16 family)